jgi:hypothetical protein
VGENGEILGVLGGGKERRLMVGRGEVGREVGIEGGRLGWVLIGIDMGGVLEMGGWWGGGGGRDRGSGEGVVGIGGGG